MTTHSEAELLSGRAQENLKTDNDFQKFVDVSTEFIVNSVSVEILTSIQLLETLYDPVTNPQGVCVHPNFLHTNY